MISEEQELEPSPDAGMADTHDLPAADPDPWEDGSIENEGPEPLQQDADESEADESDAGGSEAGDAGADGPQPGETVDKERDNGDAGEEEPDGEGTDGEGAETEELKVVLHVRNGRANAGVWRPGADPHLEVFLETGVDVLLSELPGLIERAQARWAENPMRPKYNPPKTPRKKPKPNQTRKPAGQQPEPDQPGAGEPQQQNSMARLF